MRPAGSTGRLEPLDLGEIPGLAALGEMSAELRAHWDRGQIVEILAVVSLFWFLNRWSDSLATPLEEPALRSAAGSLGGRGWEPGKHAR